MFKSSRLRSRQVMLLIGLGTASLAGDAFAGERLFHRKRVAATPVQQAVVAIPVQVATLSPAYVPVVQAPVTYAVNTPQAATTPIAALAPVIHIKLEAPSAPASVVPAPQAASSPSPMILPVAAAPTHLYVVPAFHPGLFKHRSLFGK